MTEPTEEFKHFSDTVFGIYCVWCRVLWNMRGDSFTLCENYATPIIFYIHRINPCAAATDLRLVSSECDWCNRASNIRLFVMLSVVCLGGWVVFCWPCQWFLYGVLKRRIDP